MTVSKPR